MLNDLTSYQLSALMQLTAYREKFYDNRTISLSKRKTDSIQEFIHIFCEHNFADTDYSIIQQEPLEFNTVEEWISQASLPAILKCFTYYIWTDKIMAGYFKTRIDNGHVEQLLQRLKKLLKEQNVVA